MKKDRNERRQVIHRRIRRRVAGSAERPRLSVYRTLNHIYVPAIADAEGRTLAQASTLDASLKEQAGGNVDAAKAVGALIADRLKALGVGEVVFDRGGYLYHGRIKALADAAREGGIQF
jgi:large subunit ribosomal protein L18